jgi:hypothetical protein
MYDNKIEFNHSTESQLKNESLSNLLLQYWNQKIKTEKDIL